MRSSHRHLLMSTMSMAGFIGLASGQELSPDMKRMVDMMETATPVQEQLAPAFAPFHKGKGQRRKNKVNRWKGPQGCMRN